MQVSSEKFKLFQTSNDLNLFIYCDVQFVNDNLADICSVRRALSCDTRGQDDSIKDLHVMDIRKVI